MKDEGGLDSHLNLDTDEATGAEHGSRRLAREGAEFEALLGEETPPAPLWRRLQAQLRREGIIN